MRKKFIHYGSKLLLFVLVYLVIAWAQKTFNISSWEIYSRILLVYTTWICFSTDLKTPE